jgi:hypothetical protein
MRIFYVIYAAAVVFFLWNSQGDTVAKDFGLKATLVLWCIGLLTVPFKVRGSQWVALAAFAPLIGLLLFQSGSRVAFILEHGGMDCATCNASPMAFLLGWIMECILLVPAIFLCIWLVRGVRPRVVAHEI